MNDRPHSRKLLILRHAKSDWNAEPGGRDHDRPLNARGRRDAPLMGRFLAGACPPDLVITSSATRAHDTVLRAAEAGAWDAPIEIEPAFYESDPGTIFDRLRTVDDGVGTVLIAGHQPTWSDLVSLLTGASARMPTAAIACIELRAHAWRALGPHSGSLRWLVTPKILQRGSS